MNAFDTAWSLLKDSATTTEYIYGFPYAEEGFGPQNITLDIDDLGADGGAMIYPGDGQYFPFNRPYGYSTLNPLTYFNRQFPGWGNGVDSLTPSEEIDIGRHMAAVGMHEATHQAVNWAEPKLVRRYREHATGHEYPAYTAEHEGDTDHPNIRRKLQAVISHPAVHGGNLDEDNPRLASLREIWNAIKDVKDPYDQAQIMGNRARMNAQREIERLSEKAKVKARLQEAEDNFDWANATDDDIRRLNAIESELDELERWYDFNE